MKPGVDYRIEGDAVAETLTLTLAGEWTIAATEALGVDLAKMVQAMVAAGARHGEFRTLVDIVAKRSHTSDVIADFRRFVHHASPSRRVAIVSRPDCLRADQAIEIGPVDRIGVFTRREEAVEWLDALPRRPCSQASDDSPLRRPLTGERASGAGVQKATSASTASTMVATANRPLVSVSRLRMGGLRLPVE